MKLNTHLVLRPAQEAKDQHTEWKFRMFFSLQTSPYCHTAPKAFLILRRPAIVGVLRLIRRRTYVLRIRRACSSVRLGNWKSRIELLLSQSSSIIVLMVCSKIFAKVEARRQAGICQKGEDFRLSQEWACFEYTSREVGLPQTMDNEVGQEEQHFFRMMVGILSSPVEFLFLRRLMKFTTVQV